jgi:hypothetical protein
MLVYAQENEYFRPGNVFSDIRGEIFPALELIYTRIATAENSAECVIICNNSKLLSGFPWPIIIELKKQNKTAYGI